MKVLFVCGIVTQALKTEKLNPTKKHYRCEKKIEIMNKYLSLNHLKQEQAKVLLNVKSVVNSLTIMSLAFFLFGCTSSVNKVIPPNPKQDMKAIYFQYGGGDEESAYDKRAQALSLRDQHSENWVTGLPPHPERIRHLYPKISNPDLFMYVRPQAIGESGAPIPAFITRFSMYEKTHYALPGETVETLRDKAVVDEAMAARDREIELLTSKESTKDKQLKKIHTQRHLHRRP